MFRLLIIHTGEMTHRENARRHARLRYREDTIQQERELTQKEECS